MSPKVDLICDNCGKEFQRWPAEVRRHKGKYFYCNFECFVESPKRRRLIARLAIERSPIPTIEIPTINIGYMAGIIDGEGSFNIWPAKCKSLNVSLQVANTNKPMIDKLYNDAGVGRVNRAQYKEGQNNWLWYWSVSSRVQLSVLLPIVIPSLIAKKRQAQLVLKFCQRRIKGVPLSEGDWQLRELVKKENKKRYPP